MDHLFYYKFLKKEIQSREEKEVKCALKGNNQPSIVSFFKKATRLVPLVKIKSRNLSMQR